MTTIPNPAALFTEPLVKQTQHLVGGVKRLLVLPCELPVSVYVETLLPAALDAFFTILEPDPKEVYHKVSGKSFICDVTTAAEQSYKMSGLPEGKVTRFLFKSAAVFDQATWYFFLADVAVEGLANWTSFAYAQRKCNAFGSPNYGSGSLFAASLHGNGIWGGADFSYDPPSKFSPVAPTQVNLRPGHTGQIAASLQYRIGDTAPVGTSAKIEVLGTNIILDTDDNTTDVGTSKRPNRVWAKYKNTTDEFQILWAAWNCTTIPPTVQCFGNSETAHCTMVSPD